MSLLYLADFLPDFFSQTNSLCLEDFLCYSKIITYVRHETFSLVLNSQIWAKNMLPIKLFRLAFCLFRFNRNIENLCFGIEAKQPKQTVSKQTEKNPKTWKNRKKRKNSKFSVKNSIFSSLWNMEELRQKS